MANNRAVLSEVREGAAVWMLEELVGPEKKWQHIAAASLDRGLCGEPRNGKPLHFDLDRDRLCPDCDRLWNAGVR